MEAKQQLRERLLAARRSRSSDELAIARAGVRNAIRAHAEQAGWRCVAGYLPLRTEPGSLDALGDLRALGVRVLVPVLLADRDLTWLEWDGAERDGAERDGAERDGAERDGDGATGAPLGVAAIATADAVLVPALAVARDGVRLGRGGGSYDRALARVPAGVPRIALLFDGELVAELPREPWDEPVTAVITPSGLRNLPTPA
ncbi:5-formyltetrahydrofolate cyclo-ligase [Jatrophihabitans cynanchi]|uniref:5-formyltetrahydrofolate cyclo-ligase n=1 Tax=Jatrophihabitans cynanchi TaxID=2944128 RepID=A0ABY7JWW5_9ACTN|nr:5-formyltetrahydrofolate cyclo-ligase [Jatrophihabitans sp. SB3-54]WAX55802.1 5-formyltetrahydrofolate cyclo-ligase [Jatrophihabitans sp. SB3-54]